MGFHDGKKSIAQLKGCHGLYTSNGESVLKRTAIADVVYSTQTGIRLNRGHYIRESQPLSIHTFIEIGNTTEVHRRTCFKVYIAEGVALICMSLNKN